MELKRLVGRNGRLFFPESEEEQKKLDVMSYSLRYYYPEQQRKRLTAGVFKDIIQRKSKDESLKIVMLFHREGIQEFHVSRYIQACWNFYFILEDFYADGKTNRTQVTNNFKSNQTLRTVIQDVLDTAIKPYRNHLQNIENFCRKKT